MIVINFKNYKTGKEVLDLVRTIDIYCNKALVCVPFTEMKEIAKETTLPVYAQHVDYHEKGKGTGYVIPESLINAGAVGSLLNHSEHRLSFQALKRTIARCHEKGFKLIVCVRSVTEAKKIAKLYPYAIAFEDPKLIATGKSITHHDKIAIKNFVEALKDTEIIPLCGAGITDSKDVAEALILGCKGVLISSAVANSQNPEKFLKEVSGLF